MKKPCTNPKCGSSDAMEVYDDGHTFCFSCNTYTSPARGELPSRSHSLQVVPHRGLTEATERKYGILTEVTDDGDSVARHYPYPWGGWKVRTLAEKRFYSRGDMKQDGLFGKDKFPPGPIITIVEGEEDAPAAYQMLYSKYPVVSVRSSSSAYKDCVADRDYLNSFGKIFLCLDNDETGRKATREIAQLFDFNKVYDVKLQLKDASDYLVSGRDKEFRDTWHAAKRFLPQGIVSTFREFGEILRGKQKESIGSYPFKQLQSMAYGFRAGEICLITAQEGIGKTEIIRAIEYHLLRTTQHNLAAIHLEESKFRQLAGLAGYHLEKPCHLPDSFVTPNEIENALNQILGRDERLHLYSHFDNDDPDAILDTIRFLGSACDCKFVFLDHISQIVSGMVDKDERQTLDFLTTKLARMVEDLGFCLILVSHVNDNNQTRSSRYISKVADLRVHLYRDLEAADEAARNTTDLIVLKNRFGAQTGPAGKLHFDPGTFMLSEQEVVLPPVGE
jgi:twinkle protein